MLGAGRSYRAPVPHRTRGAVRDRITHPLPTERGTSDEEAHHDSRRCGGSRSARRRAARHRRASVGSHHGGRARGGYRGGGYPDARPGGHRAHLPRRRTGYNQRGRAGHRRLAERPQWAADDLEATFTATPVAGQPGVWDVKVYSAGVYHAFANPRTGVAWKATGPMGGWIDYQVTSPNIPGARNLPAISPGTVTTSSLIGELFGGQAQITGGGHYWFGYDLHGGPLYLQQG